MHYRIVMPPKMGAAQMLRQTLAWLQRGSQDAGGSCPADEGLLQPESLRRWKVRRSCSGLILLCLRDRSMMANYLRPRDRCALRCSASICHFWIDG